MKCCCGSGRCSRHASSTFKSRVRTRCSKRRCKSGRRSSRPRRSRSSSGSRAPAAFLRGTRGTERGGGGRGGGGPVAALLAQEIGLSDAQVALIRRAAPLHDVGKIGIPDSVLLKLGKLTDDEFTLVKTHTTIGARILSGSRFSLLQLAEEIAFTHHERWDGDGYAGITGAAIPLAGRIVAVADVFDALTQKRPYKAAWPVDDAMAEIERQRGKQFDPALVDAFLRML